MAGSNRQSCDDDRAGRCYLQSSRKEEVIMSAQTSRQSSKVLIAPALCMAMQMTGFAMILPLYARRFDSFGAGVEALGLSAAAYALSGALAGPFIGLLADRVGRRPFVLLSLAGYVLVFCGYLLAGSAWLMIVLRGLAGIFTAGLFLAMTSIVGDLAAEDRRARWVGIVNGGAAAGWIVGPCLGGLLYDRFGYELPFGAAIAMALAALLLAVSSIPETTTRSADPGLARPERSRVSQAVPDLAMLLLPLLISFGVMFAWGFIEPPLMFYAYGDLGWTSSQMGLVISMSGLSCTVGQFALGHLSDRRGRRPVLALGLALFSAQFIGLLLIRDLTWIVVSFVLAGLGNALYDAALSAHLLDITPPQHTARILGLRGAAGSLGSLLGPATVVLLTAAVNPQAVFLISAALVLVLAVASGLGLRVWKEPHVIRGLPRASVAP